MSQNELDRQKSAFVKCVPVASVPTIILGAVGEVKKEIKNIYSSRARPYKFYIFRRYFV